MGYAPPPPFVMGISKNILAPTGRLRMSAGQVLELPSDVHPLDALMADWRCEYCRSEHAYDRRKCPNCGAPRRA